MVTLPPTESQIMEALALARQQPDVQAVYRALLVWAAWQISVGNTQEGGDVLAFLRGQPLEAATAALTDELWEELVSRACPRVIFDAQDFGTKAALADVLEYVGGG
jgi:hypothetical protein